MSYENMLFAKAMRAEKENLKKQAEKNQRIRNFNQTIGKLFDIAGMTINPLFAVGGSAVEWLNPEKKYKTELFLSDEAKSLNRERKSNVPKWYNALADVGIAYAGYKMGGEKIGESLKSDLSSKIGSMDLLGKLGFNYSPSINSKW